MRNILAIRKLLTAATLRVALLITLTWMSGTVAAAGTGLGFVYGTPPAPPLVGPTHGGDTFDLSTHRGRVVLVNFWATWCPPCRAEMPALEALRNRFDDRPFDVVAVHMGPGAEHIDDFLAEMNPPLKFSFVIDERAEIGRVWDVKGLPVTWIINKRGQRVYDAVGEREWNDDAIAVLVEKLLDEQ